jgi:hypothetical protein
MYLSTVPCKLGAMPHTLTFHLGPFENGAATLITPHIDGVSLVDLVERFERGSSYIDPAGGYGGLVPALFNYGPLDVYFLGAAEGAYFARSPGRIFVLGCTCGEVGCWPLVCVVDDRGSVVVWSDFEQPHRPNRDYSGFGPFVFDKVQYKQALLSLKSWRWA